MRVCGNRGAKHSHSPDVICGDHNDTIESILILESIMADHWRTAKIGHVYLDNPYDPLPPSDGTLAGIAAGVGMPAITRIPIPKSDGLFVELRARNFKRSTSSVFLQDRIGKKHLRLDYGKNPKTGNIDYHWNQKGVYSKFGIQDHTPAPRGASYVHKGSRAFKYLGRTFLVVGVASDVHSIVYAENRPRQVTKVAAGWAGAGVGCKAVGAGGAAVGSFGGPVGIAVGGLVGCAIGSAGGYFGASWAAGEAYDAAEEVWFEKVPEVPLTPDLIVK